MTNQLETSPRQRILGAVITCIEKDGFENLTTRKIAEEAGTNIASINYYFRSKDLLVAETLAMTVQHMQDDLCALIERPAYSFVENLFEVFLFLIEGGLHFPGTTMAHMYGFLVEKRYDAPVVKAFHHVFALLVEYAAKDFPSLAEKDIRLALVQVLSSAFFIMLAPGFFSPLIPLDLSQSGASKQLAHYLTRAFARNLGIPLSVGTV